MTCKIEFPNKPNSYWITSSKPKNFPELKDNVTVDVAIIGGGIAGISTAYLLSQAGLKVAVIEANHILQGTTGHTTAKLTSQHSFIYAKLIKEQGEELARQYAKANDTAIHTIAKIAAENGIECDFIWQSAHLYTTQDKYLKEIEDEIIAARSLGIKADFIEAINLPITIKGAMRFSEQAQYHPVKFLRGLADLIIKNASNIYENTEAIQILENEVISRQGYRVKADKIVIATHYPFFDGGGFFFSRIYQDRTYILGITIDGNFPEGYYINAETPTRSLRSQPLEKKKELVLVAGEHHKSGQGQDTDIHYQNLLNFAHETFKVTDVLYRWSTQDCMTLDGIPYIGNLTPRSPNIYVATGFNKWGMTNGMAAGLIISDLIIKGQNEWAKIYSPQRITPSAIKSFIIENVNVAKNFIKGKLENFEEEIDIEVGEAALIEVEGNRIGVYKDEDARLYMVDTTCTHLGCELNWNSAEKSWDCPCHGSRFSYKGEIIAGPAIEPLKCLDEGESRVEARIFK